MTLNQGVNTAPELDAIVEQLKSKDSDERRWAVYDMENFDSSLTIDYLVEVIQDEHRAVREAASELLATIPPEISVKKLVPLLGSIRIEVRNIVASVLVQFGDGAVESLIPAFEYENEDVRKFAADILGLAGSDKAVPGLCKVILEDSVENVVVSSIEAIGKIGSKKALPALYQVLDEKDSMKVEAAEAIGLIGDPESTSFLEERLNSDDPLVAYAIIDALGNIGKMSSLPLLKEYMTKAHALLKEQTCRTILKIGQRNKVNVLNDDESNICEIVFNCIENKQSDITDLVVYQLSLAPDLNVLNSFFRNTEKLPSALLVALINAAKTENKLVDMLSRLVDHSDDWVAYTVVEVLSGFENQKVKSTILGLLSEERGLPAIAAIKASVSLQIEEAKPALLELSKSENEDISFAATEALKDLT